ncbi:hypothetical protein D8I24_0563 (plasmid) [Cupriavidus necator H850]|uniref:hypothetical protein n=1 Tax=Cupriavidus necator TaxID=106590 RepID=UPI003FA44FAC|nr:hypothetical protein D8I24_0563 [Cupriavidus necator H850]
MVDPKDFVAALDRHVTKRPFLVLSDDGDLEAPAHHTLERTALATSVVVYARMALLELHVWLGNFPIAG